MVFNKDDVFAADSLCCSFITTRPRTVSIFLASTNFSEPNMMLICVAMCVVLQGLI
jgi:hypothetical protein